MSARVSVRAVQTASVNKTGGPDDSAETVTIAVKAATTSAEIDRLAAEADRIRQVSHPGVVSFVDHRVHTDEAELHTLYVGTSLERWSGGLPQVAGLLAALATTVADLHDAGVVHGRLEPSHVLVRPDGRPVLCGLSPPPDGSVPGDDVAALGELLRTLLAGADAQPGRSSLRKILEPAAPRRRLTLVADRATDPLPERRPSARALARALLDAMPEAELPEPAPDPATPATPTVPAETGATAPRRGEIDADLFATAFVDLHDTGEHEIFGNRPWHETGRHPPRPAPRPSPARAVRSFRRHAVLATIVGILALGGTAGAWALLGGASGESDPGYGTTSDAGRGGSAECAPEPAAAAAPGSAVQTTYEVDISGDGCPEQAVVTADGVVEIGGERWAVGEPGDIVALGDWDCNGASTPALYRQASGDVFVFTEWADDGQPVHAGPVEQVEGGVALVDSTTLPDVLSADGCDVPVVQLASGGYHPVEVTNLGR
jgi:hypothetical protein